MASRIEIILVLLCYQPFAVWSGYPKYPLVKENYYPTITIPGVLAVAVSRHEEVAKEQLALLTEEPGQEETIISTPCNKIFPGLTSLQRPIYLYSVPIAHNETEPIFPPYFIPTCSKNRTVIYYDNEEFQMPDQFSFVAVEPKSQLKETTKESTSYEHIMSHYDKSLWGLFADFIKHMLLGPDSANPDVFINQNTRWTSVGYVRVEATTGLNYHSILQTLTEEFKSDCATVVENDDLINMRSFIRKYGSSARVAAVLGGKMNVIVTHSAKRTDKDSDIPTQTNGTIGELRTRISGKYNVDLENTYVHTIGGRDIPGGTIDDWARTISQAPAVIGGETVMLIKFCPNVKLSTIRTFNNLVKEEMVLQDLRLAQIRLNHGSQPHRSALLAIVNRELDNVTPRSGVVAAVNQALAVNENLQKFFITKSCDQQTYHWPYSITSFAPRGVCLTVSPDIKYKDCYPKASFAYSPRNMCFIFYHNSSCSGDAAAKITHPRDLKDHFKFGHSFKHCSEN